VKPAKSRRPSQSRVTNVTREDSSESCFASLRCMCTLWPTRCTGRCSTFLLRSQRVICRVPFNVDLGIWRRPGINITFCIPTSMQGCNAFRARSAWAISDASRMQRHQHDTVRCNTARNQAAGSGPAPSSNARERSELLVRQPAALAAYCVWTLGSASS